MQRKAVYYLKVSQTPMNNKNKSAQSEGLALFLEQSKRYKATAEATLRLCISNDLFLQQVLFQGHAFKGADR